MKGQYKNGFMQGKWKFWYENRQLKGEGYYNNGDGGDIGSTGIPRNGQYVFGILGMGLGIKWSKLIMIRKN